MDKTDHNQWLEDVFAKTTDGIVLMALDGTILNANPAFARILGRNVESICGKQIQDLIPAQQRAQWTHDIEKLINASWTVAEGISLQATPPQVPLEIHLIAHVRYENQPAVVLQLRDVTIFHTVERALMMSEDQWARSFDAISDVMCLLDRSGHTLRANRSMTRLFQSTPGNLIGRHYRELFGDLTPPGGASAGDLVSAAPCEIEEITFPHTNGWFSVSTYPLHDNENVQNGAILIAKDITESRALRKSLKTNENHLRQAAKMEAIGRLASGIAHDFNNLLTSILGFSSLIFRSLKADDPHRKDLQEVIRAAERATSLTRQLLYFSQEQKLDTKTVQLNSVIENIESFLHRTIGENVRLNMRLSKELWLIRADISRLEQILINLSINARDAMPKGGQLTIETSNQSLDAGFCQSHPGLQPGRYILIEISDTGHGMPPEVLEHIFEPFFTTKKKGKGTGLGLTTIYGIVSQLGGYIACDSEVSKGTSFNIYLPQCLDACQPDEDIVPQAAMPRGHETVLVVDDEPNVVNMIDQLLNDLGYKVLAATGSSQALVIGATHPDRIDLALIDVVMPDLRGPDLGMVLAKKRPDIKVLFMSGYAGEIARQSGGLRQNESYLQKPFSLHTLASCVRQALDNKTS